ncbi:hypothetical protein P7C70_g5464, partial [Phenoliferia sp. Uapishka_3]
MSAPSRRPAQWARMSFDYPLGSSLSGFTSIPEAISPTPASVKWAKDSPSRPTTSWRKTRTFFLFLVAIGALVAFWKVGREEEAATRTIAVNLEEDGDASFRFATPVPALDPYEKHPIHDLMKNARKRWQKKLGKQSATLGAAVAEYRKRYRRDPPPGFQMWFDFARRNNVQLVDEFDSINHDIAPFFSLPPAELRKRIALLEKTSENHSFLRIRQGKLLPWTGAKWRDILCDFFVSEIEEFVRLLPDLDIPLYLHDGPFHFIDAEAKQGYLAAAEAGDYADESALPVGGKTPYVRVPHVEAERLLTQPHSCTRWRERSRTCPLDSPMRKNEMGLENRVTENGPSFIYNLNPENEIPFSAKPHHKVIWRGSPDGVFVGQELNWRTSHRFRAIYLTNSNDSVDFRKLRLTKKDFWGREYQVDQEETLASLNERYMNVRATHKAVQCEEELCKHVDEVIDFAERASLEEMADHRFVLDIDGNAYSARFRTHLESNQVPLKSTRYPEWYSDRIEPWLHYVPLREDYSDLYNILAFYTGDLSPERVGNHDELAEEIAVAGKEWAAKFWRPEDTKAYIFRLLLEYARLMDPAREEPSKSWPHVPVL